MDCISVGPFLMRQRIVCTRYYKRSDFSQLSSLQFVVSLTEIVRGASSYYTI